MSIFDKGRNHVWWLHTKSSYFEVVEEGCRVIPVDRACFRDAVHFQIHMFFYRSVSITGIRWYYRLPRRTPVMTVDRIERNLFLFSETKKTEWSPTEEQWLLGFPCLPMSDQAISLIVALTHRRTWTSLVVSWVTMMVFTVQHKSNSTIFNKFNIEQFNLSAFLLTFSFSIFSNSKSKD